MDVENRSNTTRRHGVAWFVACAVLAGVGGPVEAGRPNIVFILADDLGWSDLGCYGADLHETPHLDALARMGLRFTQAYAPSPVCSPTRAAIMTGKSPARLRMTVWSEQARGPFRVGKLQPAESLADLPATETTLASCLQQAGYLTAMVGKWHLGDADHGPQTHGFDVNVGGTHWGAPQTYFFPYRGSGRFGSQFRYIPGLDFGAQGEYLTDRLTDEAVRIIGEAAKVPERPFLLYLAHHAVHTPLEAKPKDIAHFATKLRPNFHHRNPTYAAMVRSLDESVGRVIAELSKRRLLENTIVVFASDNGGLIAVNRDTGQPATSNAPLRSGKGSLYEGGVRVPLLVHWPCATVASRICERPVMLTDWFPTLLSAAGLHRDPKAPCDGVDLRPLLINPSASFVRRDLCFHYPHYYDTTTPASSIRRADWKLIHYYEDDRDELYDLSRDPQELHDIGREQVERARELRGALDRWLAEVRAALPRPR